MLHQVLDAQQRTAHRRGPLVELVPHRERVRDHRPELLGSIVALHEDGTRFTQAVYFTVEAEAREGERKDPPAEVETIMTEMMSLMSDLQYFDLIEPWLYSPTK